MELNLNDDVIWCHKLYRDVIQLLRVLSDRRGLPARRQIKGLLRVIERKVVRFPSTEGLPDLLELARTYTPDGTYPDDEPDCLGWYLHLHACFRSIRGHIKTDWRQAEHRAITILIEIEKAIIYHACESMGLVGQEYWRIQLDKLEVVDPM